MGKPDIPSPKSFTIGEAAAYNLGYQRGYADGAHAKTISLWNCTAQQTTEPACIDCNCWKKDEKK